MMVLHLHLIPRFAEDPRTTAWKVADLYRHVEAGQVAAASGDRVNDWLQRARAMAPTLLNG